METQCRYYPDQLTAHKKSDSFKKNRFSLINYVKLNSEFFFTA
ncbi:hypothetical protein MuYL_2767 [Mucilaginibacter xinganensis]|uniref:Uncharacterized protein n=1 Tax=Mucilaginibacter xinganensis TaxID=1234841 RepID=A0A223NY72_9SPHI|nr:hypothetical protein MuYL_2767 [Mucilaginibacter xinganensis]